MGNCYEQHQTMLCCGNEDKISESLGFIPKKNKTKSANSFNQYATIQNSIKRSPNSQNNIEDSKNLLMITKHICKNQTSQDVSFDIGQNTHGTFHGTFQELTYEKSNNQLNPQIISKVDIKIDSTKKTSWYDNENSANIGNNNFLSTGEIMLKQTESNFVDQQKCDCKDQNNMVCSVACRLDPNTLLTSLKKSNDSSLNSTAHTNHKFIDIKGTKLSSRQQYHRYSYNSQTLIRVDENPQVGNNESDIKKLKLHKDYLRKMPMSQLGKRQQSIIIE